MLSQNGELIALYYVLQLDTNKMTTIKIIEIVE